MPKQHHKQIPDAALQGVDSYPDNPAMAILPTVVQIRDPKEHAARIMDYAGYVSSRYGGGIDESIQAGGRRYRAITGPVSQQFKRGTHAPNPFTPLTCLLAQSSEIDVSIAIESYYAYQRRFEARKPEWHSLGIIRGQEIDLRKEGMDVALSSFPDGHFDEINCRFPKESSPEFARLLLDKLNISGSLNPQGASVLIGMKFGGGKQLSEEFDKVVEGRVHGLDGFELRTSLHNVGGAGSPAKLYRVVKKEI